MHDPAVAGGRLQGVPGGVAVVQDGAPAGFTRVLRHHLRFEGAGARHHIREELGISGHQGSALRSQQIEQRSVADDSSFDDLGPPRPKLAGRQGFEVGQVGDYGGRLVDGTDQVLAGGHINGCLPADAAVDHGQQGGRHLDIRNAPQPGSRGESGHVPHGAPSQGDQCALAVDALGRQELIQPGQRLD